MHLPRVGIGKIIGLCAAGLCLATLSSTADAVIVLGGRDSTGTLDNSGRNLNPAPNISNSAMALSLSDYVGTWGSYLGTPIAPRYFITANHIGDGGGGGTFTFNNGTATPTTYSATLAGVHNDLAIWKISDSNPAFSLYAPLYTGSSMIGNSVVSIGRGWSRSTAITSPTTSQQAGWNWGSYDGKVSWGANTVAAVGPLSSAGPAFGGDMIKWTFNNNGNPDTGMLAVADSGGPLFAFNPTDNQYELAGINSLVDQVSSQPDDPNAAGYPNHAMLAALYDARGFYYDATATDGTYSPGTTQVTGANPVPLSSYDSSTASSSAMAFITSVVPEPGTVGMVVIGLAAVVGRRRRQR